jgi:hypothetical protein
MSGFPPRQVFKGFFGAGVTLNTGTQEMKSCASVETSLDPGSPYNNQGSLYNNQGSDYNKRQSAQLQRTQIVDHITLHFATCLELWLTQLVAHRRARGRHHDIAGTSVHGETTLSLAAGRGPLSREKPKRKRGARDVPGGSRDGLEGGDDRDDPDDPNAGQSTEVKKKKLCGRKLACPFFKRCPAKYLSERTCLGPGWLTTRRVKYGFPEFDAFHNERRRTVADETREHVLRSHMLPKNRCIRCCEAFDNAETLCAHAKASPACVAREDHEEGVSDSQEVLLRSRPKGDQSKSEEERWTDIFRILFPTEANVPCPCGWSSLSFMILLFELTPGC